MPRTALPAPGDDAALCRLVGQIMSQRLDRDRPQWECWVIEGLADGRWAVLSKVHHCMADGVSGNQLYSLIFDDAPKPAPRLKPPPTAEDSTPEPNSVHLTLRAVGNLLQSPTEQIRLLAQGLRALMLAARQVGDTTRGSDRAGSCIAAGCPVIAQRPDRPAAPLLRRASLPDVVGVGKALHVIVNDVVLAAVWPPLCRRCSITTCVTRTTCPLIRWLATTCPPTRTRPSTYLTLAVRCSPRSAKSSGCSPNDRCGRGFGMRPTSFPMHIDDSSRQIPYGTWNGYWID